MTDIGRKVARPPSWDLRKAMAFFASESVSVTMFCMAPPRAISIAVLYSLEVFITLETGPWIPLSVPFFTSFITSFTLWAKPSRFLSRSSSILAFPKSWSLWSESLSAAVFIFSHSFLFASASFSFSDISAESFSQRSVQSFIIEV